MCSTQKMVLEDHLHIPHSNLKTDKQEIRLLRNHISTSEKKKAIIAWHMGIAVVHWLACLRSFGYIHSSHMQSHPFSSDLHTVCSRLQTRTHKLEVTYWPRSLRAFRISARSIDSQISTVAVPARQSAFVFPWTPVCSGTKMKLIFVILSPFSDWSQ